MKHPKLQLQRYLAAAAQTTDSRHATNQSVQAAAAQMAPKSGFGIRPLLKKQAARRTPYSPATPRRNALISDTRKNF